MDLDFDLDLHQIIVTHGYQTPKSCLILFHQDPLIIVPRNDSKY